VRISREFKTCLECECRTDGEGTNTRAKLKVALLLMMMIELLENMQFNFEEEKKNQSFL
jgi:hypothetical protein